MIEEITTFKTSDGKYFECEGLAEEHQEVIDTERLMYKFVDDYFYSQMCIGDIARELVERIPELKEILTGSK